MIRTPSFAYRSAVWTVAASLTAVAAAAAIVFGMQSPAEAGSGPAAPQATPVSVTTVAESQVNAWDESSGRLEAV